MHVLTFILEEILIDELEFLKSTYHQIIIITALNIIVTPNLIIIIAPNSYITKSIKY